MFFFKKLRQKKIASDSVRRFNSILQYYHLLKHDARTTIEQIGFIDFMMQCIRNEIVSEVVTETMYSGTNNKWYCLRDMIPTTTNENDEK